MPLFDVNDGTGAVINFEIIENVLPHSTLFLHGNLSSNRWWYPSLEIWKNNSRNKKYEGDMILAEFRGSGKSSAPKSEAEVNMFNFADDFIKLINYKKFKKVNLVGHSTGGIISAIMLSKDSNLFNKALLLNPVGPNGYKTDEKATARLELMKTNKSMTSAVIGAVIYKNDANSDFFKNIIAEDAFICMKNVGAEVFKTLNNIHIANTLKSVENSVLVAYGEFDNLLSEQDSIEMAKCFKNGTFLKIKNQGHCINVENPKLFVEIANKFLFA